MINFQKILSYLTVLSYLIVLSSLFAFAPKLKSDTTSNYKYRLGIVLNSNYNLHKTKLPIIWDLPDCGTFQDGTSFGQSYGLVFQYPIYTHLITMDTRILYSSFSADFTTEKNDFRVFNPQINSYQNILLKYNFHSDIAYFSLQPALLVQPLAKIPVKVRLGMDFSNPLSLPQYQVTEEIASPLNYVFPDETQKHTIWNGEMNSLGTSMSAIAGILYSHKLNKRIEIAGEAYYQHPLNSRTSDNDWKTTQFGVNATITYAFNDLFAKKKEKVIPPPPPPDTTIVPVVIAKVEEPKIAKLSVVSSPLEILETTITEAYPILPYIFFDKESSVLKYDYSKNSQTNFDETKLSHNSIEIYHNVLNIIGSRLSKNKNFIIRVIGYTDGEEIENDEERLKLAGARANTIANYLIKNWKIDKKQIKVIARDEPMLKTSSEYDEGSEENRRVEIESDNIEIFQPVVLTKFKEFEILSKSLEMKFSSKDLDSITIQNESLNQINVSKKNQFKSDKSKEIINIDSNLIKSINKRISNGQDIEFSVDFLAYEKSQNTIITIPINKQKNTHELQRLNLIVFDFDKFKINQNNEKILKNFVANSIQENSEIRIIGSTDILGTPEYNMQLSQQRAEATKKYLQSLNMDAKFTQVEGIGDTKLKYDNSTPEGRFYSRTVLIEVKTPINK